MARKLVRKTKRQAQNFEPSSVLNKIETDLKSNQSKLSLFLGALIILVIGVLIFNYFKAQPDLGPSQQTETAEDTEEDVAVGDLPGKYTVKEDDTLFLIAEKYYQDGSKFTEIAKANNLSDPNTIEAGQVLEIPKLEEEVAEASPSPTPQPSPDAEEEQFGTGGADTTIWGPKIEGDSYTVVEGDWLSTIAARAYGDIFAYEKLAETNNIPNPDLIFPGQVINIPR